MLNVLIHLMLNQVAPLPFKALSLYVSIVRHGPVGQRTFQVSEVYHHLICTRLYCLVTEALVRE